MIIHSVSGRQNDAGGCDRGLFVYSVAIERRLNTPLRRLLVGFRSMYEIGLGKHIRRMITASDILSLGFSEQELRRHFSPSISAIADSIGVEVTITLVLQFGGSLTYIPARITPSHKLAKSLGLRAAERLSEDFGGTSIPIPNSLKGGLLRKALAVKLMREGRSITQIAQAVGICRTTVCEWKKLYFCKHDGWLSRQADFATASKPVERVITLSSSQCASAHETVSGDEL